MGRNRCKASQYVKERMSEARSDSYPAMGVSFPGFDFRYSFSAIVFAVAGALVVLLFL